VNQHVIGREPELAAGDRFLDALAAGPSALVLSGEAGIGKSVVWEELTTRAEERGYAVLAAQPAEAETKLSLAGLADLLANVADAIVPGLAAPQRRALEVALLRLEPNGFVADWRAIGTGFLSVLRTLTASSPVLVAVDDLHWLDRSSLRVLDFAARRLGALPVGVLVTVRTAAPGDAARVTLRRSLSAYPLDELELGPLSLAALYQLLRTTLGQALPRPTLLRIEATSQGNPFYALEIARELIRTGAQPGRGEPLPLPRTLSDLAVSRIRRLPAATREALLVAASASSPTLELAVAVSGRTGTAEDLERAEDAGIVSIVDGRISFTHPLLSSAVYASASHEARRRVHRRLAGIVRNQEERARHLALSVTRRDERVAAALAEAAERLAARGAPDEAAELAELAAGTTPVRDIAAGYGRRLAAARHHATAGDFDRARTILGELLERAPAGTMRAEILLQLASTCRADFVEMTTLCERALGETASDPVLEARLHERLAASWHIRGRPDAALAHARAGLALAETVDDARLQLMLRASVGLTETWAGTVTPGLLERGAALEAQTGEALPFEQSPRAALGVRLFYFGRMDEARTHLRETLAQATATGDEVSRVTALLQLAALELFGGDWQASSEYADAGLELEEQLGAERGVLRFYRALLAAGLGEVEEALSLAEIGLSRAREVGEEHIELLSTGVVGFVELSLGNAEQAAGIFAELLERDGASDRPKTSRYYDDGIEALVAVGDTARATRFSRVYTEAAESWPMPIVRAKAARCRGLTEAAAGNLPGAFAELEHALALHTDTSQPFDRARTLLSLGIARRRAKQKRGARDALAEALTVFASLPAPLWAEKARAELRRVGLRPAASDGLTETELRVAELAAAGLRNREIAAQAHLTPKSVEGVLTRVYRKLDVRSRAELVARMPAEHGD
jgi:DNA-binding CsgD family transcriptional regulator